MREKIYTPKTGKRYTIVEKDFIWFMNTNSTDILVSNNFGSLIPKRPFPLDRFTVDENIIATIKLQNNFCYPLKMVIYPISLFQLLRQQ